MGTDFLLCFTTWEAVADACIKCGEMHRHSPFGGKAVGNSIPSSFSKSRAKKHKQCDSKVAL